MFSIDDRKTSFLARFNVASDMFVVLAFMLVARGRVVRVSRCSEYCFIPASRVFATFYIVSFFQTHIHQFVETMNMVGIEEYYFACIDILWARGVGIVSKDI